MYSNDERVVEQYYATCSPHNFFTAITGMRRIDEKVASNRAVRMSPVW